MTDQISLPTTTERTKNKQRQTRRKNRKFLKCHISNVCIRQADQCRHCMLDAHYREIKAYHLIAARPTFCAVSDMQYESNRNVCNLVVIKATIEHCLLCFGQKRIICVVTINHHHGAHTRHARHSFRLPLVTIQR